jgi:hypothetical protein
LLISFFSELSLSHPSCPIYPVRHIVPTFKLPLIHFSAKRKKELLSGVCLGKGPVSNYYLLRFSTRSVLVLVYTGLVPAEGPIGGSTHTINSLIVTSWCYHPPTLVVTHLSLCFWFSSILISDPALPGTTRYFYY